MPAVTNNLAPHHDAYAADYDEQVRVYGAYLAEVLFGLAYEAIRPGQRLLDLGIGSGLSAALFAQAGLDVFGMDFSPAMLDLCRTKGIAVDLRQQDLLQTPWPYPDQFFDHAVCCGVFHFIAGPSPILGEARRVLKPGGRLAFTTKDPSRPLDSGIAFDRQPSDGLDVFSHAPAYVGSILEWHDLIREKALRCFVGDDIFRAWLVRNSEHEGNERTSDPA
jgi:SAM-dependent methyltransferase